jgi:NADH dehydrogenase/NADH:ubiquinone oxidoreductase subunit G
VLPGASWVEKDGAFVNGQGRLQAAARAIAPPGDAQEDWQVFVNVGMALGTPFTYTSSAAVRGDLATALKRNERYAGLATLAFARPVSAKHWLQASNPSERWKWDVMFQDMPPVKFAGTPRATAVPGLIPLQKVD